MHLMYLDASGDPGWPPPAGRSATKYYVLGGLVLEEERWAVADSESKMLIAKYFPFGSPSPRELRYASLIAGAEPFNRLSRPDRKKLADDTFQLIKGLDPTLFAIAIDKLAHWNKYDRPYNPKTWAMQLMAPRFEKFLARKDSRGMFIMDEEEAKRDAKLRQLITDARELGIVLQSAINPDPLRTDTKLPRVVESIFFARSEHTIGLQLVDFCAHAVWRHFERNQSNRFHEIEPLLDKDSQGNVVGLKKWPP